MGGAELVPDASSPPPCSHPCPSRHRYEGTRSSGGASKHLVEKLTSPACHGADFPGASLAREQPGRQDDPSQVNTEQRGPAVLVRVPHEPQAGLEGSSGAVEPSTFPPPALPVWAAQTGWSFPLPHTNLGPPFSYCFFCMDF